MFSQLFFQVGYLTTLIIFFVLRQSAWNGGRVCIILFRVQSAYFVILVLQSGIWFYHISAFLSKMDNYMFTYLLYCIINDYYFNFYHSWLHSHLYCDVISLMRLSLSPIVLALLRLLVHAPPKFKEGRHFSKLFLPKWNLFYFYKFLWHFCVCCQVFSFLTYFKHI